MIVSCSDPSTVIRTLDSFYPQLPRDIRRKITHLQAQYLATFDFEGLWKRVNGKSLAEILQSVKEEKSSILTEGEVNGVTFSVIDESPTKPLEDGE